MSRQGLFPVTLATLMLTGVVLTQAGWFSPAPPRRPKSPSGSPRAGDSYGLPTHL